LILYNDSFAVVAFFLFFATKQNKKKGTLAAVPFCDARKEGEEEEGDGNKATVAFFSGFFWKAEGDGNCHPLLHGATTKKKG
jgi:hypothetical protein